MYKNTPHSTLSKNEKETAKIADKIADKITKNARKPHLIYLNGTLGAGKSVFARSFIRKITGNPQLTVPSPTFTLVQTYESPHGSINHYDLYRLENPEEIFELGWEDSITEGITLVEWPQRLAGMKPPSTLDISIKHADNGKDRIITITGA